MQDRDVLRSLVNRIGSPIKDVVPPHAAFATVDSIRHFARAYGDDNPLYSDPEYAAASARGALTAPPLFPIATGTPRLSGGNGANGEGLDPVDLDRMPGMRNQTILGDRWLLCRPIAVGTRLERERKLLHVALDESRSAGAAPSPSGCDLTERTTYHTGDVIYAVHDRRRRYRLDGARTSTAGRVDKASY